MLDFKKDIAFLGGWLTANEGLFLYKTAQTISPDRAIVEIGSWKGRSTVCLAKGSLDGYRATVYAVDLHTGSSEHVKMFGHAVDTYADFLENIRVAGVDQVVWPLRQTSAQAAADFHKPIGLLFIDGAHEFKLVELDYRSWFPKVENGGTIAIHDSWHFPGPHLMTAIILLFSSKVKNPKLIDTITCFTKVEKNSWFNRVYNLIFGVYGFLKLKYKYAVLK